MFGDRNRACMAGDRKTPNFDLEYLDNGMYENDAFLTVGIIRYKFSENVSLF